MINGATCNGTDHSGCGRLAATAKVGVFPFAVAVDDAIHTAYVTNKLVHPGHAPREYAGPNMML